MAILQKNTRIFARLLRKDRIALSGLDFFNKYERVESWII
jgi:hypothetical protein